MSSKFDTLCEDVMKSLQEGEIKVGQDAYIDGEEQPTPEKPNKGNAGDKHPVTEGDDVVDDEDMEKVDETCGMDHDDDDDMNESDEIDGDDDDMEEGAPNAGQPATVDGSELHKTKSK